MVRNAVLQLSVVLRPRGERELYARAHAPAAPRLSRRDLRAAHVPPLRQVEAVAVVPFGAFPTDCHGYYRRDLAYHLEYARATATAEGFEAYVAREVRGVADHGEFLTRLGAERLAALATRRERWWSVA